MLKCPDLQAQCRKWRHIRINHSNGPNFKPLVIRSPHGLIDLFFIYDGPHWPRCKCLINWCETYLCLLKCIGQSWPSFQGSRYFFQIWDLGLCYSCYTFAIADQLESTSNLRLEEFMGFLSWQMVPSHKLSAMADPKMGSHCFKSHK